MIKWLRESENLPKNISFGKKIRLYVTIYGIFVTIKRLLKMARWKYFSVKLFVT